MAEHLVKVMTNWEEILIAGTARNMEQIVKIWTAVTAFVIGVTLVLLISEMALVMVDV